MTFSDRVRKEVMPELMRMLSVKQKSTGIRHICQ